MITLIHIAKNNIEDDLTFISVHVTIWSTFSLIFLIVIQELSLDSLINIVECTESTIRIHLFILPSLLIRLDIQSQYDLGTLS